MYKFILASIVVLMGAQGFCQNVAEGKIAAEDKMALIMKDCQNNPAYTEFGSNQGHQTNFNQMTKFLNSMKAQEQIDFQIKMSQYLSESENCVDYIQRFAFISSQLATAQNSIENVAKLFKPNQK